MANSTQPSESATSQSKSQLPGDLAMWFFILAELTVFAILFISFGIAEQLNETMFSQGKQKLHSVAGLINTLALITSSYFVALSLHAVHQRRPRKAFNLILVSLFFACIYIVVKLWEYQALFDLGITIETNTFFTLYFLVTGFHFMHILLGMVILIYIGNRARKGDYQDEGVSGFEAGASYWHMVDLLWIILFPLIYVI